MTSTTEECFRSVKARLEAIRMALEEGEIEQSLDEIRRAVKDLEYGLRLLNDKPA